MMPWSSLIYMACAYNQTLLPCSPCEQRTLGLEPISQTRLCFSLLLVLLHCGIWSQVLPPTHLYTVPVPPAVPRHCGLL